MMWRSTAATACAMDYTLNGSYSQGEGYRQSALALAGR
jgi:hypothetical protein